MSEVIMNEDGVGFVNEYTPNLKLVIPYFDIATWHDYIDYNFKTLDATINYIYKVVGFTGEWKKVTTYKVDDFVFINDKNSQHYLKLAKIVVEHTTNSDSFDTFYNNHEDYYEIYNEHIITNGIKIVKIDKTLTLSANQQIQIDLTQYTNENKSYYCIINYNINTDVTKLSNVCTYNKTNRTVIAENYNTEETTVKIDFIMLIPVDNLVGFDNNINGLTNGLYQVDSLVKQSQLNEEINNRQNADNNIINSIGNGTITLTQGGVVKGTFTTNQNENTTIYLDAGGSGGGELPKPVVTRKPTFVNSTTGYIDVSDFVETDKQYTPIVITSDNTAVAGSSIAEARKNLYSKCSYDSTNRRIVLTYSDNSYVQTNSFSYALILLPIQTGTSIYVTGITDGLNNYLDNAQVTDNLVTSISSSSTDTEYPSAKCMYDIVGDVETLINAL